MSNDTPQLQVELVPDGKGLKTFLEGMKTDAAASGNKSGAAFGDALNNGANKGFSLLSKTMLGVGVAIAAAVGGKKALAAAAEQQDAINSLNNALGQTGKYSDASSASLQAFSSQLQENSRFGDEVILGNMALIQSLGNLSEGGLKQATQAAADMSAALGVDLTTASMMVGNAAQGEIGTFSKLGVEIKKGSTDAETFANALTALNSKFGGRAAADILTSKGSYEQFQNTVGDTAEVVGDFAVKSPLSAAIFSELSKSIKQVTVEIGKVSGDSNALLSLGNAAITVGQALNMFVVRPLEIVWNTLKIFGALVGHTVNAMIVAITKPLQWLANALPANLVPESWKEELNDLGNITGDTFRESGLAIEEAFSNFTDMSAADGIDAFAERVRLAMEKASEASKKGAKDYNKSTGEMSKQSEKTASDVQKAMAQHMASGISQGIQKMANSLASGEGLMSGFGKFMMDQLGDLAIKIGEMSVATGFAAMAMKMFDPGGAIAFGAGLIAVGAAMKAFWGSGGSTSSIDTGTVGAGGAVTYGGETSTASTNTVEKEKAEPITSVSVNIHGNVLDSSEAGMRIVKMINEAVGKNGARLVTA